MSYNWAYLIETLIKIGVIIGTIGVLCYLAYLKVKYGDHIIFR
jgi:hypothetical protein